MLKRGKILLLSAVLLLAFSQVAFPALRAVGPVIPDTDPGPGWSAGYNGFPLWFRDSLGQNAALSNPPSPLSAPDPVDPANPFSVQVGWGAEAFYWSSEANAVGQGIDALLVLALEAAWAAEVPNDGDQVVFARVRIRIDTPVAGDYTVIFPYGQKTFTNVPAGVRAINETADIGIGAPGVFTGALRGEIGPFLRQVGAAPGTFGDGTPGPVEFGPNGNILRVTGPGGIQAETNIFVTTGEMFNGTPFNSRRTSFTRNGTGNFAEVFATIPAPLTPGVVLTASVNGEPAVPLTQSNLRFFGQIPIANPVFPAQVAITGTTGGLLPTTISSDLVDTITITKATFSVATGTLTVAATSTDNQATLRGFGWVGATPAGQPLAAAGVDTVFTPVVTPPINVKVRSSSGGESIFKTIILP